MATDCEKIKANLDSALAAYQDLMLGKSIKVYVDSDGSRIEYSVQSQGTLYKYIQILQAQYDACVGNGKTAMMYRPLNPYF